MGEEARSPGPLRARAVTGTEKGGGLKEVDRLSDRPIERKETKGQGFSVEVMFRRRYDAGGRSRRERAQRSDSSVRI